MPGKFSHEHHTFAQWERACSRKRWVSWNDYLLTTDNREQVRSHNESGRSTIATIRNAAETFPCAAQSSQNTGNTRTSSGG